jgi:hypothetical protein
MSRLRKIIVSLIMACLFATITSMAQEKPAGINYNQVSHRFGDIALYGSPDILFKTPNGVLLGGGIKFRLFLTKRLSLDADVVFARDYLHAGPGLIGIPAWLIILTSDNSYNDEGMSLKELGLVILAGILSFEHLAYHIPVNQSTDLSPYVSLLRFKYAARHNDYSNPEIKDQQLSFATGLELNKYFGKFTIAPYLEYNIGYVDKVSGVNAGVYLGYCFLR